MVEAHQILIAFGFVCIIVGGVCYFVSSLMERYYDRKLYELERRLRIDDSWRRKQ
jgi:hypothetical protein